MLVLTRKLGESVVIGDGVTVKISEIKKGTVKLAIDAPKCVRIFRRELLEPTTQPKEEADA